MMKPTARLRLLQIPYTDIEDGSFVLLGSICQGSQQEIRHRPIKLQQLWVSELDIDDSNLVEEWRDVDFENY